MSLSWYANCILNIEKLQIELEDSMKEAQLLKERNEALSDAIRIKDSDVAAGKLELSQLSSKIMCLRKEYDDLGIKCSDCANRNEILQNDIGMYVHYCFWLHKMVLHFPFECRKGTA